MKKFFTLVCGLIVSLCASAQIEITTEDGKVIQEGETVVFYAEEIEVMPGYSVVDCIPKSPYINNKSGETINATITVEKTNEKDALTICAFGGCKPPFKKSITIDGPIAPGSKEGINLHAEGEYGVYYTYVAKVTVSAGKFKRTFYEKFVYDKEHAGIEDTQNDKVSIANNQLSYSFGNPAHRVLNVYGVSGRLVKNATLSQHGNVALNLNRGVYIYEILANGKRTATHKFIVK